MKTLSIDERLSCANKNSARDMNLDIMTLLVK